MLITKVWCLVHFVFRSLWLDLAEKRTRVARSVALQLICFQYFESFLLDYSIFLGS